MATNISSMSMFLDLIIPMVWVHLDSTPGNDSLTMAIKLLRRCVTRRIEIPQHTKGGLTGGFASSLAFVPSLKLGIVALLNGNAGAVTDEVNFLSACVFVTLFKITAQALAALVPAVVSELKKNQPVRRLPSNYKSFLGSYCIENTVAFPSVVPLANFYCSQ